MINFILLLIIEMFFWWGHNLSKQLLQKHLEFKFYNIYNKFLSNTREQTERMVRDLSGSRLQTSGKFLKA